MRIKLSPHSVDHKNYNIRLIVVATSAIQTCLSLSLAVTDNTRTYKILTAFNHSYDNILYKHGMKLLMRSNTAVEMDGKNIYEIRVIRE